MPNSPKHPLLRKFMHEKRGGKNKIGERRGSQPSFKSSINGINPLVEKYARDGALGCRPGEFVERKEEEIAELRFIQRPELVYERIKQIKSEIENSLSSYKLMPEKIRLFMSVLGTTAVIAGGFSLIFRSTGLGRGIGFSLLASAPVAFMSPYISEIIFNANRIKKLRLMVNVLESIEKNKQISALHLYKLSGDAEFVEYVNELEKMGSEKAHAANETMKAWEEPKLWFIRWTWRFFHVFPSLSGLGLVAYFPLGPPTAIGLIMAALPIYFWRVHINHLKAIKV